MSSENVCSTKTGSFGVEIHRLYKFFRGIEVLIPEIRLHISSEGICGIAVDTANVALVKAEMTHLKMSGGFPDGGEVVLGLDISRISTILKYLIKEFNLDETSTVTFAWDTSKVLPLIDIASGADLFRVQDESLDLTSIRKDPNFPKIDLPSQFYCDGNKLISAVNVCSVMSDYCRVEVDEKGKCFLAARGDGKHQCRLPIASDGTAPSRSRFSLDYLKDVSKVWADVKVKVALAADHPLMLSGSLAPGVYLTYFIAPRIPESEPEDWLS